VIPRICLTIARFALAAWVGAAVLFVINGVRQVTFPGFDSPTKDQLALIRFPAYYVFGFALVSAATVCLWAIVRSNLLGRLRRWIAALLTTAALALMVCDYMAIYRPLEAMISRPGGVRPANFVTMHDSSKRINSLHVGLCLGAAIILCWPRPHSVSHIS